MAMSERKRKLEPAKLVDDYSDLCDTLKDKYKMTDGDWKTMLDSGMALYKCSPDRPHVPEARGSETTIEGRLQAYRTLRGELRRHADAYLDAVNRLGEAHAAETRDGP